MNAASAVSNGGSQASISELMRGIRALNPGSERLIVGQSLLLPDSVQPGGAATAASQAPAQAEQNAEQLAADLRRWLLAPVSTPPGSASAKTTIIQNASTLLDLASPVMLDREHLGWVRIGIGRTQLDTRIKELLKSGLIYLLSGALMIVFFASVTGRYFTRRLSAISRVAEAVRTGDASQRVRIRGIDEAASLAREFNNMLDTLQQRESELLQSKDALRIAATAFESNDVMFVCDAQWRILQVNRAFERVTGYTPEYAVGKTPRDLLGSNLQR